MLLKEWNMDEALAVRYEEGREDTLEEVFSLLEQGVSVAEAKKILREQARSATA